MARSVSLLPSIVCTLTISRAEITGCLIFTQPLLHKTLLDRRELLRKHFEEVPGEFGFAKASDGESTEEIQVFLDESVKDGCEGLMVKMIETDASFYEPSRRSVNWLKVSPPRSIDHCFAQLTRIFTHP